MKIAASITSWIGGAFTILLEMIYCFAGINITVPEVEYISETQTKTILVNKHIDFPIWAKVFLIIIALLTIAILICREISVNNGHKVAVGVLTIIFAGTVGGILTLCIPFRQLYKTSGRRYYNS